MCGVNELVTRLEEFNRKNIELKSHKHERSSRRELIEQKIVFKIFPFTLN